MAALNRESLTILKTSRLAQDLSAFLIAKEAERVSARYLQFLRDELRPFLRYLADVGVDDAGSITPAHIRAFLLMLARRRNAGGCHCFFRACKTFLRWYATEYDAPDVAQVIARVKAPKLSQEALEPVALDVVRALLDVCGKDVTGLRDRAIILTMLDTGLRVSELCALDVGDVSMTTGLVLVRAGKGGKARATFLGAKSRRELTRYLRMRGDAPGPLFVGIHGERLTRRAVTSMLRRRAKRAGVKAPSPHSFRRAFALLSLRAGADLLSLQRLLGHADLTLLRRYVKQTVDDLQAIHAQTSPVDRL